MDKPKFALASPNIQGQTPRPQSVKSVSIASTDSHVPSNQSHYREQDSDNEAFSLDGPAKHHKPSLGRKIIHRASKGLLNARTPAEILKLRHHTPKGRDVDAMEPIGDAPLVGAEPNNSSRSSLGHGHLSYRDLMRWIQKEKARRTVEKARNRADKAVEFPAPGQVVAPREEAEPAEDLSREGKRRGSDASSHGDHALDMLQEILEQQLALHDRHPLLRSNRSSKTSLFKKLRRQSTAGSSDTDQGEPMVPTCEAMLDNSKTLSYTGGTVDNDSRPNLGRTFSSREKDAWKIFKYEIVRLAHTLKLKGWRRVSLERSDTVGVERLSGALTNAVYVVTPPRRLLENDADDELPRRSRPRKLLLRIYGAQVEHLIDRESELHILKRLARKRIGPRLLGTFTNGRFEEFLNAQPLTAEEMRERDVSRQIAKRMRELHDGIELLDPEVAAGPFVWQNINKWIARAEKIVRTLESANHLENDELKDSNNYSYLLGADFGLFKEALNRYRKWLEDMYDGQGGINDRLVFAHNDAQYGNILRLVPERESPLLLPTNEHKRLVVIDFEYANANVPGLEFANHFTEWCYNYHDKKHPHACKVSMYPTPSQQVTFLAAYVTHRASFHPAPDTLAHRLSISPVQTPYSSHPSTPAMLPMTGSMHSETAASARTSLVLPAPASDPLGFGPVPLGEDDASVKWEVERLRRETRAWRGVNSAQWVLWGIVQAKLPAHITEQDIPRVDSAAPEDIPASETEDGNPKAEGDATDDEDGFDYLSYTRERAMFFWGDVISFGIMTEKELPVDVVKHARMLDY